MSIHEKTRFMNEFSVQKSNDRERKRANVYVCISMSAQPNVPAEGEKKCSHFELKICRCRIENIKI